MHWERFLAHRHWITLSIFGKDLHLCARCSGTVLGFMTLKLLLMIQIPGISYFALFDMSFLVSLLLALPSIVDWTTQTLGFRQSNNSLRLFTGFLEGLGIEFLSLTNIPFFGKLLIIGSVGLGVVLVSVFGRRLVEKLLDLDL